MYILCTVLLKHKWPFVCPQPKVVGCFGFCFAKFAENKVERGQQLMQHSLSSVNQMFLSLQWHKVFNKDSSLRWRGLVPEHQVSSIQADIFPSAAHCLQLVFSFQHEIKLELDDTIFDSIIIYKQTDVGLKDGWKAKLSSDENLGWCLYI